MLYPNTPPPTTRSSHSQNRTETRQTLEGLLQVGIQSVKGKNAVADALALAKPLPSPSHILAVGKAAVAMYLGLPDLLRADCPALIVTKDGHTEDYQAPPYVVLLESAHPVPNQASLLAGSQVYDFVRNCGPKDRLLLLVSGGASALVEHLREEFDFNDLIDLTTNALSRGLAIGEINTARKQISRLKGGQLLAKFGGRSVDVLAISDVRHDAISVIGSGLGHAIAPKFSYNTRIIAANHVAREAIQVAATEAGLDVHGNTESLYGDINEVSSSIKLTLETGLPGLYIFGGEPTVELPENPGNGGRNQGLALLLARDLAGRSDIALVVAGTDGSDGVSDGAGAFVDGNSFSLAAGGNDVIIRANSGQFFKATGDQIVTGPTGTNVMDVVIALKT